MKSTREAGGSLTVEAALVLPVFIYAVIAIVYFLQIIIIQEDLQDAITRMGFQTVKYAYVYDYLKTGDKKEGLDSTNPSESQKDGRLMDFHKQENKDTYPEKTEEKKNEGQDSLEGKLAKGINSIYFKVKLGEYVDADSLNHSCIHYGLAGIHTYLSSFMEEDENVDIVLSYSIKLPLLFIDPDEFKMLQRIRMKGWNGHKPVLNKGGEGTEGAGNEAEKMVYITETGTVYHLFKNCSHLKLSVRDVSYQQIEDLRNESGGKYKPCERCQKAGQPLADTVYITDTGDRYHWDLNCSGLKRSILTIPISEVGNRSLCRRCGSDAQ